MPIQPLDPTDPTTVGPYRLLARLGAGGMGLVYLARSAGGRTAAVKVVRPELAADQEFRRRFGREVAAARAVGGAFTAPVVDADPDGPVPWLATAYVLGPSLTQAVSTHGPLPAPSVRALGAGLARALVAVHGAGLVHRDLKPSNVLLATDGPRVIDFGIARALDDERLTGTGLVVGSAGFMSPEQAAGSPTGPASDVFSLGAVLVYAATGAGPFSGAGDSSAAAQLYRVIHDEPSLDALPEELWPVVAACLAKDPADRLTPAELVELLGGGPDAFTGWLPSPVASEIAGHAAAVLDLEVPDRGSVPATGGGAVAGGPAAEQPRPATAPTPTEVVDTNPLTVPTAKGPSRRLLLTGGGAVLLAALGGAAWALTGTDKPGPKPVPPQQPTARPTAPQPSPTATRTRAKGEAPDPNWSYRLPKSSALHTRAVCAGDLVYLGGDGLYALGRKDGKVRWSDPDATAGDLSLASGTIAYSQRELLNVDAAGGAVLWSYGQKPGTDPRTVLVAEDVLAADERAVYALCSFMTLDDSGLPSSTVPQAPGIFALSHKDGSVLWSQHRKPDADRSVAAVLAGGMLLYTDSEKNLVARSTTTGEQLWFADTDAQALYQPATDGTRVFCSAAGTGLQAVTVADGKPAWVKTPPQKRIWFTPAAVGDGVAYSVLGGMTVTLDGTLYTPPAAPVLIAFQADSGAELWRLPLTDECTMTIAPFLVKDTLFVATNDKGLFAVDTKAHTLRWVFRNGISTDVAWQFATDGEQLIALQDDRVYALPLS